MRRLIFLLPVLLLMVGCERKTLSGRYKVAEEDSFYLEFDQSHVVFGNIFKFSYPYRIRGNTLEAGPGGFHKDDMAYMVIEGDGSITYNGEKYRKVNQARPDPVGNEKR